MVERRHPQSIPLQLPKEKLMPVNYGPQSNPTRWALTMPSFQDCHHDPIKLTVLQNPAAQTSSLARSGFFFAWQRRSAQPWPFLSVLGAFELILSSCQVKHG